MQVKLNLLIIISLIFSTNLTAQFTLEDAFPNISLLDPIDLQNSGDGTNRIFVAERAGRIKVFPNSQTVQSTKIFLNITDRVSAGGEMGLLGLAFHPDYENNRYFYVNYTVSNPRMTRISRFTVSSTNPDSADKNSELIILTFSQPNGNHNGGWLGFGPHDGYLYIGVGDGGGAGDTQNNAQNITNLLGTILRIDVDNQDTGLQYAIPLDNPFVDSTGNEAKEIFAWGMRNPWRNSFDPVTGWLWSGDVGQNSWEEIDIIEKGKNYGWRCYEGNHNHNLLGCNYPEYIFPVWEYSHGSGCSVTGGYVYRGTNVPELTGKYIYADYCNRTVWSLEYDGINPPDNQTLLTAPGSVTSFGVDECNELYVVGFSPDRIYRFTPTAAIIAPTGLNGLASITLGVPPEVIVDLWWTDNSNNEDGFIIERKTNDGSFEIIDSVNENETTYTDWSVTDTTTYKYRVKGYNSTDLSGYCYEFTVTTPLRSLQAPSNLLAQSTGPNEVELTWDDNAFEEEGFKIERRTGIQGTYSVIDSVAESVHNYSDQSVISNSLYYYRVFAYLGQIASAYSNEDSAITPNISVVEDLQIPLEYNLKQNFPNPFNPATIITYSIPEQSYVTLKIYNVLGNEVTILVNESKPSGIYNVTFDASDVPSGIYFYTLKAENFSSTKKMIYLK